MKFWPMMSPAATLRCVLLGSAVFLTAQLGAQTAQADPFAGLDVETVKRVYALVDLSMCGSGPANVMLTQAELEKVRRMDSEKEMQRLNTLHMEPGLGPYLVAIAAEIRAKKTGAFMLAEVFKAMTLRADVKREVLQSYIQQAQALIENPPDKLTADDTGFLKGAPALLVTRETPEHEELLVKLLQLGESRNEATLMAAACRGLSQIGTARSLLVMEEAMQWMQQHQGETHWPYEAKWVQFSLQALRARLAKTVPLR